MHSETHVLPTSDDRWLGRVPTPVTIVVPVHNAAHELARCIEALVRNTTYPATVMLIDDASSEPDVAPVLADAEQLRGVQVLRNTVNLGFSATVNRGIRACRGHDVVVLNSDTAVTPNWLERLVATAYSDPLVATVTPISDNAGAFSAPEIGTANAVPQCVDDDTVGRVIAQSSERRRPRAPTGNAFCLYIKRAVIDEIGYFDAEAFPRGYGEENDFCLRALNRGWHHLVDDAVFVHHVREASFGSSREELMAQGRAIVDERYPHYTALVSEFVRSPQMNAIRATVAAAYGETERIYEAGSQVRPRVLFVAHEGAGGTPATNLDLMSGLSEEYDCWLLTSSGQELRLDRIEDRARIPMFRHALEQPISPQDFSREDYREVVGSLLDRYGFELVHVRHLFKHTFDLPALAAARGIPVVLSFHDFYFVCPTVHLLDERLRRCEGVCTPGLGHCRIPSTHLEGLPPLKHRFVHEWRDEAQRMLAEIDCFVTTSPRARSIHLTSLPVLERRPFEIIEHGRSLAQQTVARPPTPGGPVRIAVPTTLDLHKGAELIREILAADSSGRIEFTLFGEVDPQYADLGRLHGRYARDEFADRLAAAKPAFVGIFSIWHETYSHVLSEAWAAGLPVIATALGAPAERIERHGGGWLIDPDDPGRAVETILAIADDRLEYARGLEHARVDNVRTIADMAGDYSALYRRVIERRRALTPLRRMRGRAHLSDRVLRCELLIGDRAATTSAQTRLVSRYLHPRMRRKLQVTLSNGVRQNEEIGGRDLVIAQPGSLSADQLRRLADHELPLVLDIDVDPFADGDRRADEIDRLLARASLVTVASRELERRIAPRGARVLTLRDALDERLFLTSRSPAIAARTTTRALFIGADGDPGLDTVQSAIKQLRRGGLAIELDIVSRALPYRALARALRDRRGSWDLGVAPLGDGAAQRSRGDLPFLEYGALALPAVYPALEPFEDVVDGVTGLVVPDRVQAWGDAIARLARDRSQREAIATGALAQVRSSRLVSHDADRLLAALFDLDLDGLRETGLDSLAQWQPVTAPSG